MFKDIFNTKERCYNGGSRHEFEARYSEKSSGLLPTASGGSIVALQIMRDMMIIKVYEGDVCKWCGKKINKNLIS